MSTQSCLQFVPKAIRQYRESKREKIKKFFELHLGEPWPSAILHGEFGPSFRTRVSELNRDESWELKIRNVCGFDKHRGTETSIYYSVNRSEQ